MSIFDKLAEERYEIPFSTRAAYFHAITQPFGVPPEPTFTKEAQVGMLKIGVILNQAKDEEQAIQAMQRQALTDPNVQQALDYQQAMAEREDAMVQLEQMNQQVVDAETRAQEAEQRAMQAEQGAEQQGMQLQEMQGQLEQEQQGRQEATQMAVQARDQSLGEQINLQEQKQNIAMQAEAFQQQANMLSQQLRQTAATPTAPPQGGPAMGGGPPGVGEMPPPGSADAAQEQQEAANAEQEAAVQGEQAAAATEEDMAKQEAQGGGQPQMSPEEEAAMQEEEAAAQEQQMAQQQQMADQEAMAAQAMQPMPKQGSLLARFGYVKEAAVMSPQTRGAIIGAAIGALGGVASGMVPGAMTGKSDSPGAPTGGALRGGAAGAMAGAVSGATGGALLGHAIGKGDVGKQLGKAIGGGALILGAPAVGALSGLRSSRSQDYRVKSAALEKAAASFGLGPKSLNLAKPGSKINARMTNARNVGKPTGKVGNVGQLTESDFMPKTGSKGLIGAGIGAALGGAAGAATGKDSESRIKRGLAGAAVGGAAGSIITKRKALGKAIKDLKRTGQHTTKGGTKIKAKKSDSGDIKINVDKGTRVSGSYTDKSGRTRRIKGVEGGKDTDWAKVDEATDWRHPGAFGPNDPGKKSSGPVKTSSAMGKCSACGKMSKLSELGKCGMCGAKHKTASGIMVTPKGSRRLSEQEEAALLMNAERLPKEIVADVNRGLAETMQGLMPEKTAGEVTKRLLGLAKRKAVGAGVGAVAGGGLGAAEVARHEIEQKGKGKDVASDAELKAEGKLHEAKLKAQKSPSYANKINVARLRMKRDSERASRENPKGHVARRAAEGAVVGAIAEGHARRLGKKGLEALKGSGR